MNLLEGLNIEYIRVHDDSLEAKMSLTPFHCQAFGYLHGGATLAFGETVAGYASKEKISEDQAAVGQTVTANHMKLQKSEGYIIAKGKLLHQGCRFHVWSIEMLDQNNRLISHMTVTNAIVHLYRETE